MKDFFKYFLYASCLFLAYSLYKADYLNIPQVHVVSHLLLSLFFLFVGFILKAVTWQKTLNSYGYQISSRVALSSIGLSVFGKYIPGKVWAIVGPATYVAKATNSSAADIVSPTVISQTISLWTGLVFGAIGLVVVGGLEVWGLMISVAWLVMTLILFTPYFHAIAKKTIKVVVKKDVEIPALTKKETLSLIPWFVVYWGSYFLGFYFFANSISIAELSYSAGLAFPFAATVGIIALFAPGGLGVREGLLVGYFSLAGVEIADATTISVTSRLWFLIGEVFIFLIGLVASRKTT